MGVLVPVSWSFEKSVAVKNGCFLCFLEIGYRNRRIVSRDFFSKFSGISRGAAYFQVRLTYASDTRKGRLMCQILESAGSRSCYGIKMFSITWP